MAANPLHFVILITSFFWPRCRPLSGSFEWRRVAKADLGPLGELCIQAADGWPDAWPARTATRWAQWHLAQVQVSARLHQPVQLWFCQFNLMLVCWHLPLLKYPSEASAAWHASPKNYLVQFQKQWGRLTCTPDQVKKLLYCTKQKGSQASTGSSSTQDVSDRKFIHFLKHHMFLWFCFLCGIQVSWSMVLLSVWDSSFLIYAFSIVHSQVPEFVPPRGTSSGGWFRKVSGLVVAWKLGEVHRMRCLL